MSWQECALVFAPDHPSAAGHFPGNPIVPGALLLDAVLQAVAEDTAVTIRSAKFLRPVRHGDALRLRWQESGPAQWRFECVAPDGVALSGSVAT
jgi:3-hydroxymyristoyl/3-hydroxydecanoyl-(acyl carrier protein) dehydratase